MVSSSHWYDLASPEDRREYDAFGPWVYEIASADQMPPRFRSLYGDWADARFLFKVPVNRDRRDVRPGQDLYSLVVAVTEDRVGLLSLSGESVAVRSVPLDEVVALSSSQLLLHGTFQLCLAGGSEATFLYNAVSLPLIEAAMDFIRSKLSTASVPPPILGEVPTVADFHYQGLVRTHGIRKPGCWVVFCEEPRRNSGLLILEAGQELVILDIGPPVKRGRGNPYGSRCTVIPWGSWEGFSVAGSLELRAGGHRFTFGLRKEPVGLAAYLAQIPPIWSAPR